MKFSIEYKRTVRVQKYETLTIGMTNEFNDNVIERHTALMYSRNYINKWIQDDLEALRKEIDVQD